MATSMAASVASWFTPTVLFCFLNLMIAIIFIASNFTHNKRQARHGQGEDIPQVQSHLFRTPSLLDRVRSINFHQYNFPESDPPPPSGEETPHQLARSPSLLERVKSIDFSMYKFPDYDPPAPSGEENPHPHPLVRASSFLERVKSINFSMYKFSDSDPLTTEPPREDPPLEEARMENLVDHHVTRIRSETKGKSKTTMKVPAKMKKSASEKIVSVESEEAVDRPRPATVPERKVKPASDEAPLGDVDAKAGDFINRFKQQLKLQRLDSILRYKEMLNRGSAQ